MSGGGVAAPVIAIVAGVVTWHRGRGATRAELTLDPMPVAPGDFLAASVRVEARGTAPERVVLEVVYTEMKSGWTGNRIQQRVLLRDEAVRAAGGDGQATYEFAVLTPEDWPVSGKGDLSDIGRIVLRVTGRATGGGFRFTFPLPVYPAYEADDA